MDESNPTSAGPAPAEPPLNLIEARVLGCLIEKEKTTPEHYPLSLNALVNACNQKSNRHPVLALTAREVELALDGLRRRRLAGLFSGADARVAKFKHTLDLALPTEAADQVVLCELLLRGPQTTGELRSRCERMHPFADIAAVEASLRRLADRSAGSLVVTLPRQPGQKESRHAQTLTGPPDEVAPVPGHRTEALTVSVGLPAEAEARLAALERAVADLRAEISALRQSLGG